MVKRSKWDWTNIGRHRAELSVGHITFVIKQENSLGWNVDTHVNYRQTDEKTSVSLKGWSIKTKTEAKEAVERCLELLGVSQEAIPQGKDAVNQWSFPSHRLITVGCVKIGIFKHDAWKLDDFEHLLLPLEFRHTSYRVSTWHPLEEDVDIFLRMLGKQPSDPTFENVIPMNERPFTEEEMAALI